MAEQRNDHKASENLVLPRTSIIFVLEGRHDERSCRLIIMSHFVQNTDFCIILGFVQVKITGITKDYSFMLSDLTLWANSDIRALSLHASCYIKNQLGHCIVQLWMFACVFVCHWLSYKHTVRCGLGNGLAKCNTGIHCFYIVMCVNTLAFGETSFFDIY